MSARPLRVALLGAGNVGLEVARLLTFAAQRSQVGVNGGPVGLADFLQGHA